MKTTMTMMVVLFCAVLFSQANAGERTFGDGTLPSFLEVYDLDGDGVLSQEEKAAMQEARRERRERWIEQWDKDGDGVISAQEREQARDRLREMIEDCRTDRFNEADTDSSGSLSFEEFSAIPAIVALAERDPERPAMLFDRLDVDDNDLVSLEEFLVHLRARIRTRPQEPKE